MRQTPILFYGDNPNLPSGLGRIGLGLAYIASGMEEFRVGFLGRGGFPSCRFPFMQYTFPEVAQWGENYVMPVWEDFSKGEHGKIFTIWDPTRLLWFGHPVGLPEELTEFLQARTFDKWGYFAIDHHLGNERLTAVATASLRGFKRVLAYTNFGAAVIGNCVGRPVDWIPHGMNLETFKPRERAVFRDQWFRDGDFPVVGCVMTNQVRKDWGLAFSTLAYLKDTYYPKLKAWLKVDVVNRHWDLRALVSDFGMGNTVIVDTSVDKDEVLSYKYSMCDITILPSTGEGFGYPIAESLACGVPVVHGNYGGGAEAVPDKEWLVEPVAFRLDTPYNALRPVYSARDFGDCCKKVLDSHPDPGYCRASVEHLNWPLLKPLWEKWFREGL